MPEPTIMDYHQKAALLAELENTAGHDFKASVVAAELAGNGIAPDTFFFRNQSTFKRAVANDIEAVFWNGDEDHTEHLIFELNREGIYDMLPESLVHAQTKRRAGDETQEKLGNELRRQEKDARRFFSPLENEFHHRGLKLDIIERELLKNNNPRRNREFFDYFFESSTALSDQQLIVLLHILPLSHKIRGDLGLIALTLTRILNYPVSVTAHWVAREYSLPQSATQPLGNGMLGINTILADRFKVPERLYDITLSGVPAAAYPDFTGTGSYRTVLDFILPYLFPAGADYRIVPQVAEADAGFAVADEDKHSFLGFNSYI